MKLSVVIPCHNEGEGLSELVNLYAEQIDNRKDIEVILVNDASTDSSSQVLATLAATNSFLRVVTNEVSEGYGNAIISGLQVAQGEFMSWTHGDLQTHPRDVLTALSYLEAQPQPERILVKGKRFGRPIFDQFFTFGMSVLESVYLGTLLHDINAQPNIFHHSFYKTLNNPPKDFSFDLFVYYQAKKQGLDVYRFPVNFGPRKYGTSSWNSGMKARIKFIKRTVVFSFELKKRLRK